MEAIVIWLFRVWGLGFLGFRALGLLGAMASGVSSYPKGPKYLKGTK